MAAVYEDRAPLGLLDGNDLAVHQLEDFPRIVALKDLRQARGRFKVMRFR